MHGRKLGKHVNHERSNSHVIGANLEKHVQYGVVMGWLRRWFSSSVGSKSIMAVTGLLLFGFLIAHLSGNLLVYAGQDVFNSYAAGMQDLGVVLWIARIGLLGVFVLHVLTAGRLTILNKQARPQKYSYKDTVQASFASRTMIYSGLLIFLFVGYHLAHFTFYWAGGDIHHFRDELGRHDAYRMLVLGFQNPLASFFYIAAMLVLGLHLSHGIGSLFQSLGLNHKHLNPCLNILGPTIAWLLVGGFISIPLAVLLGLVTLGGA